ncbi:MAG: oxygenase MpaB family protein, partial [Actinomycetota bacterium]
YVDDMVRSLRVSDQARTVASAVLHPTTLPRVMAPAAALSRGITVEITPAPVRDQFGLRPDPRHARSLERAERIGGRIYGALPRTVRHGPSTVFLRRGRRREAAAARTG